MEVAIKPLFQRGPQLGLRTLVCVAFSVALIVLNKTAPMFQSLRSEYSVIVLPVQYVVNLPIQFSRWLSESVTTQKALIDENAQLRAHELLLEARLQKLLELERENDQLRELLKSSEKAGGKVVVGQVLAVSLDPNLRQMVIDKGSKEQVYEGQPVLDAYGVMGQLVDVGPWTSKILLITDPKSAIPVEDNRNGYRAIAVGLGSINQLQLINVPDTTDIQEGDTFVSSGFGLRYPVGYPVGVVEKVTHDRTQRFASILLRPAAKLEQSQQVLLSWPNRVDLINAVQQQLNASLPIVGADGVEIRPGVEKATQSLITHDGVPSVLSGAATSTGSVTIPSAPAKTLAPMGDASVAPSSAVATTADASPATSNVPSVPQSTDAAGAAAPLQAQQAAAPAVATTPSNAEVLVPKKSNSAKASVSVAPLPQPTQTGAPQAEAEATPSTTDQVSGAQSLPSNIVGQEEEASTMPLQDTSTEHSEEITESQVGAQDDE